VIDKFVPDVYQKSIYTINYDLLYRKGIRCLLFDFDNTMVPIGKKNITKKLKDLIEQLKDKGFKVIIVSNSTKKNLAPFKDALEIDVAAFSMKPLKNKFIKIMKMFNFEESQIAMIGDQLMTDILGGNRVGITTILVNPMSSKDLSVTLLNRLLEKKIMKILAKKKILIKGEYYE